MKMFFLAIYCDALLLIMGKVPLPDAWYDSMRQHEQRMVKVYNARVED